jgi:hypothetical protein
MAAVTEVVSGTTLTLAPALPSSGFNSNDAYLITRHRFNAMEGVREGQLPWHDDNEPFRSPLSVSWYWPRPDNTSVNVSIVGSGTLLPAYRNNALKRGRASLLAAQGACTWTGVDAVSCGPCTPAPPPETDPVCPTAEREVYLRGQADALSSGLRLSDGTRVSMAEWQVHPGAVAGIEGTGFRGVVSSVGATDLQVAALYDSAGNPSSFAPAQSYRIRIASRTIAATAGPGTDSNPNEPPDFVVPGRDFGAEGVKAGDTVRNVTTGAWGIVKQVIADRVVAERLDGGSSVRFQNGHNVDIYSGMVDTREIAIQRVQISGGVPGLMLLNGERRRSVDKNPLTATDVVQMSLNDFDTGGNKVASAGSLAGVRWSDHGARMSVANLRFDLASLVFIAAPGSAGGTLVGQTGWDFAALGVRAGDRVRNLTTGGEGVVTATPAAGAGSLSVAPLPGGSIEIKAGDGYAVHTDLPPWLTPNRWHRLILMAVADGLRPGGSGTCVPGTTCLVLQGASGPTSDKRLLLFMAGAALTGQNRAAPVPATPPIRLTHLLDDYLEGANLSPADGVFQRLVPSTAQFNDQVRERSQ